VSRQLPPQLNNISVTTEEGELVRDREPGPDRERQPNGLPDAPAVDDDRLRDHHIEEVLNTFKDVARSRDGDDSSGRPGGV
jgi:hypothetical protein